MKTVALPFFIFVYRSKFAEEEIADRKIAEVLLLPEHSLSGVFWHSMPNRENQAAANLLCMLDRIWLRYNRERARIQIRDIIDIRIPYFRPRPPRRRSCPSRSAAGRDRRPGLFFFIAARRRGSFCSKMYNSRVRKTIWKIA